jgi:endogenous inhibitor of DNA gyrase (YacG/DUF329 family)
MALLFCKHCGESFWSYNRPAYCSPTCREAGLGQACQCRQCGKQFRAKGKSRKRRFCNRECWKKWKDSRRKRIECATCGKPCVGRTAKDDIRFCSKQCQNKAREKPRFRCVCSQCGREWESTTESSICSRECQLKSEWGEALPWRKAIQQASQRLKSREILRAVSGWAKAIESRVSGLRIRARTKAGKQRARQAPSNWIDCVRKARSSLAYRARRASMSRWERKCDTTARNLRRRRLLPKPSIGYSKNSSLGAP